MTDKELMLEMTTKDLVTYLVEDYGWDMLKAMETVYHSKTFEKLDDPRTGLYYRSPAYVYVYLKEELGLTG